MTSVWLLTLIRSLFIATLASFLAQKIFQQQNYLQGRKKTSFLIIALLPLIVPPLLPAYAYSAFSFNFQTQILYNEILYCLLILFKVIPLALILIMIIPSALSKSALKCDELLARKNISHLYKHSCNLAIICLCTLFIFHDYETASLLRIEHWTVVLFNAHAGGLVMNIRASLQLASLPALTSLVLMLLSWYFLKNCRGKVEYQARKNISAFFILSSSIILLLIIPVSTLSANSLGGFKDVFFGAWMLHESINSLSITIVSLICCLTLSCWIILSTKKTLILSIIPGMFGALILGLFFIYLFNLPFLNNVKHSILPLTLATVLYGLPVSILLSMSLKKLKHNNVSSLELLNKKNQISVKWSLFHRPALFASLPLFCFLWFDLTLSSMLAPASVTTLFPRIYNLMHYSENEKLSATVIVVTLIPLVIYTLLYLIFKIRVYFASTVSIK